MGSTEHVAWASAENSRTPGVKTTFSVVIPSYNRKGVIATTLASVLGTSSDGVDVIVVDDGSTDGTIELLAEYADRITVLQQGNAGPGAARNLGAKHARAEYLAFLDSDDLWFPWTAETYASAISESGKPAFIAGSPFIFKREAELAGVSRTSLGFLEFDDYLVSGDEWRWFSASSFVVRRDAFLAAGGFKERRDVTEDVDLTLRLGVSGRFVQITSPPTFAYREHETSLKANLQTYQLSGLRYVIATEKRGEYQGGQPRALERRRIIARHARPVSVACLDAGYFGEAFKLYASLFAWHLALGRWKYLFGFPVRALIRSVRRGAHA